MEVTTDKTRNIMTSALISVLVAALPSTISTVEFANMIFGLNDQQKKRMTAYQGQNYAEVGSLNDQLSVDVRNKPWHFQLFGSENKPENTCIIIARTTNSEDSSEEASQSKASNELHKLVKRGRFMNSGTSSHNKLPRNCNYTTRDCSSSTFTETVESLLNLLSRSDVTAIVLCSNVAFESLLKEHFILHANPILNVACTVGRTTATVLNLRTKCRRRFLNNSYGNNENLSQTVLIWMCSEANPSLFTRKGETKQAHADRNNSPCLALSPLRGLSRSPCANQAIESKAELQSSTPCPVLLPEDTKNGEQSEQNSNSDNSEVKKVINTASAMDLNDQINNLGGFQFPMEFGDELRDLNEEELMDQINEYDGDNPLDGGRLEAPEDDDNDSDVGSIIMEDYEDTDCEDSDSFHGSYSNTSFLGTSPLPQRSPVPPYNAHALEDAGHVIASQTFFNLQDNFGASLLQSSCNLPPSLAEEGQGDQAVPSSFIST